MPAWTGITVAVARMVVSIVVMASVLPRRDHFAARMCGLLAATTIVCAFAIWFCYAVRPELSTTHQPISQLVAFSALVLIAAFALRIPFDASLWATAACSATGYLLQNLSSRLSALLGMIASGGTASPGNSFWYWNSIIIQAIVLIAVRYSLGRKTANFSPSAMGNASMSIIVAMVTVVCIASDIVLKNTTFPSTAAYFIMTLTHVLVCLTLLYLEYQMIYRRSLEIETAAMDAIVQSHARHYETSRNAIARISSICHDLLHEMSGLASKGDEATQARLEELAGELETLGCMLRTGNDALDTACAEEALHCRERGITLGCIADGAAILFMQPADVYTLAITLLDAAVDEVSTLPLGARSISLVVRKSGGLASIHLEHPRGRGGAQGTRGIDSADAALVRTIVERYEGVVVVGTADEATTVDISVPIPEEWAPTGAGTHLS